MQPPAASITHISAVLIIGQPPSCLAAVLAALAPFKEVILYDNKGHPETARCAAAHPRVRLINGHFEGFGPTKNAAVAMASQDWILSLDADEQASEQLLQELLQWPADSAIEKVGYICRDNYLMGRAVRYGGWGGDWLVRLFNRRRYRFNDHLVHEKVALDQQAIRQRLHGRIRHFSIDRIGQMLEKLEHYTELRRQQPQRRLHPLLFVPRSGWAFVKSYLLQGGFLAGWRGLLIAYYSASSVLLKYLKIYIDQCEAKRSEDAKSGS